MSLSQTGFFKKYRLTLSLLFFGSLFIGGFIFFGESALHYLTKNEKEGPLRLERLKKLKTQSIQWIVKDIKGEVLDLASYKNKKSIVINIWATWCAPCIKEFPELSSLAQQTRSHNLVLALTTEPPVKVKKFLRESFPDLSPQFKIVTISKKKLEDRFVEDQLPVTYLFNKQGYFDRKIMGAKDWSKPYWIQYIQDL